MAPAQISQALHLMIQSRAIDELVIKLQRLKRAGTFAPVHGQEAAVVGSAMALDPMRDWMVPASRENPAMIHHGLPVKNLLSLYMGRLDFATIPMGVKLLPRQQSIGAQLPHAAGLAWALKLRRQSAVTLVYCGDGASSEGDFHEALNLAGVMRVPLIIVLVNNQYAISTPLHKQTAAPTLAMRAAGYGFRGVAIDGNDLFAVFATTQEAVTRALDGDGPTLIECRTYRLGFHNTSDNPNDYRDPAELERAMLNDPIERLRNYVVNTGISSAEEVADLTLRIKQELFDLQREVGELPRPGPEFIFDHVYAQLSERLIRQRSAAIEENSE
jgi:pyruvate dehydrogenase E1 component alpha subunit